MDRFADAINKIKTNERIGRMQCTVYSTKLLKAVLDIMKRESYIDDYEEFTDRRIKYIKVSLSNKINSIGVIKPRYSHTERAHPEVRDALHTEQGLRSADNDNPARDHNEQGGKGKKDRRKAPGVCLLVII